MYLFEQFFALFLSNISLFKFLEMKKKENFFSTFFVFSARCFCRFLRDFSEKNRVRDSSSILSLLLSPLSLLFLHFISPLLFSPLFLLLPPLSLVFPPPLLLFLFLSPPSTSPPSYPLFLLSPSPSSLSSSSLSLLSRPPFFLPLSYLLPHLFLRPLSFLSFFFSSLYLLPLLGSISQ